MDEPITDAILDAVERWPGVPEDRATLRSVLDAAAHEPAYQSAVMTVLGRYTDSEVLATLPSEDDVARWVKLAAAATPGPWHPDMYYQAGDVSLWAFTGSPDETIVANLGDSIVAVGSACDRERENAAFISAARAAVPELCAAVTVLRTEVKRLLERCEALTPLSGVDATTEAKNETAK